MTLVEYFSFLPYGKYAFYVWFAYGVAFITVLTLFINAKTWVLGFGLLFFQLWVHC